jgi:hypothetical protein
MLKKAAYLSWQRSHNYKDFIILFLVVKKFCCFFPSLFSFSNLPLFYSLFKWRFYKIKLVLRYFILNLFLMVCHIHYVSALSAITTNVIRGHAPYLTFDDDRIKEEKYMEVLLGIRLSDGRGYVPLGGESNLYPNATVVDDYDVIELPSDADFNSVQTLVPLSGNSSYPSIDLKNIVSANHYWADNDGDSHIDVTGSLELAWYDVNGNNITDFVKNNPTSKFDPSFAPYSLRLHVTDVQLSTQYGIPNETTYKGRSYTYYFNLGKVARVNYALPPNMYGTAGKYWNHSYGFQVMNIHNPEENFPTTGSNDLSFHLLLANITPEQVINANGTIVSAVSGDSSVKLLLSAEKSDSLSEDEVQLKLTLKGPSKDSDNKSFSPSLFKLYADSNHNQLLYSFKIDRWYITQLYDYDNDNNVDYAQAQIFCNGLGNDYRVPSVGDYTNANNDNDSWIWGVPGQKNESLRQLSYKSDDRWIGGLFNEWGAFTSNELGDWNSYEYWASGLYDDKQYTILPYGQIFVGYSDDYAMPACVTP